MIKENILIVEDVPYNIDILLNILKDDYRLLIATNGKQAKQIIKKQAIDLILMDINLPDINGIRLATDIRTNEESNNIPVIFVSSIEDPDVKSKCFEIGASDYITKPYNQAEIKARIKYHLSMVEANRLLNSQKNILEEMVRTKTDEVIKTRDAAINAVSSLVETRDSETSGHINRTKNYVLIIAETLRIMGKYVDVLTPEYIYEIERASPLHDIGKIGIPDHVLLKPGKLTKEEFEIVKQHPVIGYKALASAKKDLGENSFFDIACDIAMYHHEKWNGKGYPSNLKGDEIPLAARIMSLADVYDALTSERIYKEAYDHEKSKEIIIEGSGNQFDPNIVDAFIIAEKLFKKVAFQNYIS